MDYPKLTELLKYYHSEIFPIKSKHTIYQDKYTYEECGANFHWLFALRNQLLPLGIHEIEFLQSPSQNGVKLKH